MKYLQIGTGFLILLFSCTNDRSKRDLLHTTLICQKNIYSESFVIASSGALGGERVSEYITDSADFRIYIGTYDNADEAFSYNCKDDTLEVFKVSGRSSHKPTIWLVKRFSILDLKDQKKVE